MLNSQHAFYQNWKHVENIVFSHIEFYLLWSNNFLVVLFGYIWIESLLLRVAERQLGYQVTLWGPQGSGQQVAQWEGHHSSKQAAMQEVLM